MYVYMYVQMYVCMCVSIYLPIYLFSCLCDELLGQQIQSEGMRANGPELWRICELPYSFLEPNLGHQEQPVFLVTISSGPF